MTIRSTALALVITALAWTAAEAEQPATESAAEPTSVCYSCHDEGKLKQGTFVHGPVNVDACDVCHTPHQNGKTKSVLVARGTDLCTSCHKVDDYRGKYEHAPMKDGCVGCHAPHAGKTYSLLATTAEQNCQQCHSPKVGKRAKSGGQCTTCHDAHRTGRPDLLRAELPKGDCRRDRRTVQAAR